MNETAQIAATLRRLAALDEPAILATVVRVEGSAYRRPGARMLVTPAGERIGCVSGGCLERDARLRGARLAMDEGVIISYDSRHGEETPWDLALGCNGKVDLLIERLSPASAACLGEFLAAAESTRVIATVVEAPATVRLIPGMRLMRFRGGATVETPDAATMLDVIPSLGRAVDATRATGPLFFDTDEGRMEFLVEVIHPPQSLVVFGAGWDALPVVDAGKNLGWHVTVVDHRGGYATKENFARADALVVGRPPTVMEAIEIGERTAAVVMTHDYATDIEILGSLLATPVGYVGVLGPRSRTDRLLAELLDRGLRIPPEFFDILHAPVGLALGGETPAEIALSIVGEIAAWRTASPGGPLRDHKGPIHHPAASPPPAIESPVTSEAVA